MNDEALIAGCLNGDVRAQKRLFDKFAPKMLGVCMRYTKNTNQAEDVLQEGFVKVFGKLNEFKNDGSLEGWVRKIMVNTSLDQIRKNLKFQKDSDIDEIGYRIEDNSFVFEHLVAEDLMNLIHAMPDGYRVVFNMFAIEGYTHVEIAETLGVSESTSKSQYLRARAYLKNRLDQLNEGR